MKKLFTGIVIGVVLVGAWLYFVPSANYGDEFFNEEGYTLSDYGWQSPEECTQYEKYDAEEGYCYYECDTDEQCLAIEAQIDAELDILGEEYFNFSESFSESDRNSSDVSENTQVVYSVEKGENFVVIEGVENEQHIQIKRWVAGIFPDDFSDAYLSRVGIFSDKEGDDGAYVENVNGGWEMFINGDVLQDGDEEMIFTIVHEFAHILTLNSSQVEGVIEESVCQTNYIEEGCPRQDSYFQGFFQNFWSDGSDGYTPSYFVTEYAATNPGEDIAESFAKFVLSGKTGGATVADQKVDFFNAYPELIVMRENIRRTLTPFVRGRIR